MRFLKEDLDLDWRQIEDTKLVPQLTNLYIETVRDAWDFLTYGRRKGFRDCYSVFYSHDGVNGDVIASFNDEESAIKYAIKYAETIEDVPVQVEFQLFNSSNDLIAWATIFEYNTKKSINESLNSDLKTEIELMVKGDFETGHISAENYDEFRSLFRGEDINPTTELYDYYIELRELGPTGFYQEFKDKYDFDDFFVQEFGEIDDWE
jgi:hypothetical protein